MRFDQRLNGLPVAGAGMVLHARADGEIFGVNGEFVSGRELPVTPALDAETALAMALGKSRRGSAASPTPISPMSSAATAWDTWPGR